MFPLKEVQLVPSGKYDVARALPSSYAPALRLPAARGDVAVPLDFIPEAA
jgi:hypothetical protein